MVGVCFVVFPEEFEMPGKKLGKSLKCREEWSKREFKMHREVSLVVSVAEGSTHTASRRTCSIA
mgnify:CR=1 FL=1